MSVNYIKRYAGGKVSIEVSDPNDIYKLSTLYADGSEARVVDNTAGLYRLINGAWVYVPGSGGLQDLVPLVVKFTCEQEYPESAAGSVDVSDTEIKAAILSGRSIECYYTTVKNQYGIKSQRMMCLPLVNMSASSLGYYTLEAEYYSVLDPSVPTESYEWWKCVWSMHDGQPAQVTVEFMGT